MNILTLGDVVGTASVAYLNQNLWQFRQSVNADAVIVNGENASDIHGVSSADAQAILDAGADVVTLGNHAFGRRDVGTILSDSPFVIRPANFPAMTPGSGYTVYNVCGYRMLCINIQGTALMESLACPFATVDRILEREKGAYDFAVMDIHAEATSEKIALARYFDGRIAVMFGTHTHVETADEQILPGGSGYITDLGMTGPMDGVIGTEAAAVIERFRTKMPTRFCVAGGEIRAHGALFTLNPDTKKVLAVRRVTF